MPLQGFLQQFFEWSLVKFQRRFFQRILLKVHRIFAQWILWNVSVFSPFRLFFQKIPCTISPLEVLPRTLSEIHVGILFKSFSGDFSEDASKDYFKVSHKHPSQNSFSDCSRYLLQDSLKLVQKFFRKYKDSMNKDSSRDSFEIAYKMYPEIWNISLQMKNFPNNSPRNSRKHLWGFFHKCFREFLEKLLLL